MPPNDLSDRSAEAVSLLAEDKESAARPIQAPVVPPSSPSTVEGVAADPFAALRNLPEIPELKPISRVTLRVQMDPTDWCCSYCSTVYMSASRERCRRCNRTKGEAA